MHSKAFLKAAVMIAGALALASCGAVPQGKTARSTSTSNAPSGRVASAPPIGAARPDDRICMSELGAAGARFTPVPDTYSAPGCNKLGTVQLSTLAGDASYFGVSNIGPVQCATAKAFSDWARFGVDRAAREILGSRLARIETMGSYACRTVAGTTRLSAHARAEAIDVSGFVLEDGRRINLKSDWHGGQPEVREFLRVIHSSACKRFGTVLGPEYNAAHADHFHLEGTGPKFCR
ncbi:MAG: extensin-like domain-containing protein [Erythrobacter sp.]